MKIEEYKKKKNKNVVLPSGFEIEVKRLNPYVLLKIQDELNIDFSDEKSYSSKLVEKLFEAYLSKPSVPKDIKVSEFEKKDYEKLHELVFDEVTFSEEEKKKK